LAGATIHDRNKRKFLPFWKILEKIAPKLEKNLESNGKDVNKVRGV